MYLNVQWWIVQLDCMTTKQQFVIFHGWTALKAFLGSFFYCFVFSARVEISQRGWWLCKTKKNVCLFVFVFVSDWTEEKEKNKRIDVTVTHYNFGRWNGEINSLQPKFETDIYTLYRVYVENDSGGGKGSAMMEGQRSCCCCFWRGKN